MRFAMPHLPGGFEIPDDWLSEAAFTGFKPTERAFRSTTAMSFVPLTQVEPIVRFVSYPKDFGGFDRVRLVRLSKRLRHWRRYRTRRSYGATIFCHLRRA